MRILLVYNDYKLRGGEAVSFANERDLLAEAGHEVETYTLSNDATDHMRPLEIAGRMIWNPRSYREIRSRIRRFQPEVIHCHNFYILVSPALFHAASAEGVPVVQTLHNYRLFCPAATFFRDGRVCEDCMHKAVPWPGIRHSCYRSDWRTSAAVAGMITVHRALGTWAKHVTRYIALTEFTRAKYVEGGLPADRVVVKPNFLQIDPGYDWTPDRSQPYALFVGRLSEEKGVTTLIDAWRARHPGMRLKIAGEGPLNDTLRQGARGVEGIEFLGAQPRDKVYALMREASLLLFPSIWYECLPYTLLEAFAVGLPVVVSKIGSIESMIRHNETGLHAEPGDPLSWSETVAGVTADPDRLSRISRAARDEFDEQYSPSVSLQRLLSVYNEAISSQRVASPG